MRAIRRYSLKGGNIYGNVDGVPRDVVQQALVRVRVLHGGSEVTNSPRTFLDGVNSRGAIEPGCRIYGRRNGLISF